MDGRAIWILCVGVLGIFAVSFAAPALPTAVSFVDEEAAEPFELDEESEALLAEEVGIDQEPQGEAEASLPAGWIVLVTGLVGLVILGRIALANPDRTAGVAIVGIGIVAVLAALFVLERGRPPTASGGSIPEHFSLFVAAALVAVGLGRILVELARSDVASGAIEPRLDRSEHRLPARETRRSDAASVTHFEETDVPADTDVYRAWVTLEEFVDMRAASSATPGDVQAAAHGAGLDPEAVATLRQLFEDCRYGNREPTNERNRRARELLRQLRIGRERE